MMKTSGRVTSCCVALFFALTSVSAVQRLNSINDLKKIDFDQSVPKHSLLLLHWFANTVDIDENDEIWLTFDPDDGDYGSHYYGNFDGLLDPLPWGNGYRYFTIGNLKPGRSTPLPPYVARSPGEYVGRNRDRIIIRVREQNTGLPRIDQIYITQHIEYQSEYDPEDTYLITANLLRQIREFSTEGNQQPLMQLRNRYGSNADVSHIRNTWGDLACLGLLLFIVIQERFRFYQQNNRPENYDRPNNIYRPENYDRPNNIYRPANSYSPDTTTTNYSQPQHHYRAENRQDEDALKCCFLIFLLACLFVFFSICNTLGK